MVCTVKRRHRDDDDDGELSTAGEELAIDARGDDVLPRKAKQLRPSSAGLDANGTTTGVAVDLTGALSDDVLVRVLELVPDARDLVRTGALSRRWRGLWTRVPALRFASSTRPEFRSAGSDRYVAFVNAALAIRAAQAEPCLQRLAISFIMESFGISSVSKLQQLVPLSIGAAQGWIQYAMEHGLECFELQMRMPHEACSYYYYTMPVMRLDSLPGSAKLETMRLALGHAVVQLPAATTVSFVSLTSLSLESMVIAKGTSRLLGRLLSTACCPCLHKLRLKKLGLDSGGQAEDQLLLIEAAALLELSLQQTSLTKIILQLKTPNLRVLRTKVCVMETLRISAPRLEELFLNSQPDYIDVDGELPCVSRFNAKLCSHGYSFGGVGDDEGNGINGGAIRLLHRCRSATCLYVSLHVSKRKDQFVDIINGRIPHLPYVTSLTVHVSLPELHSLRAGVSDILTQCSNLKYLHLHLHYLMMFTVNQDLNIICGRACLCKSQDISLLAHLQDVEFKGLIGTDCELWFVQSVLSSATGLQKVGISYSPDYQLLQRRGASDPMPPKLMGGEWTCSWCPNVSFEWRPYPVYDGISIY